MRFWISQSRRSRLEFGIPPAVPGSSAASAAARLSASHKHTSGDAAGHVAMARIEAGWFLQQMNPDGVRNDTIFWMRVLLIVSVFALVAHAGNEWLIPGGNVARNRRMADLPDALPAAPFWRHKLFERDPQWVLFRGRWDRLLHDRERAPDPRGYLDAELQVPYPALRPTVRDGTIFYMDGIELVTRRAGSGTLGNYYPRTRPHIGSAPYPVRFVRPSRSHDPERPDEDRYRFAWYGNGTAVHAPDATMCIQRGAVHAFRRGSGLLQWAWDIDGAPRTVYTNKERRKEWRDDWLQHRKARFLGCGVVAGGCLYSVVADSQIELWCLDLATGECRWRVPVQAELTVRGAVGAAVAFADGVAYVCTHGGTVAAIKDGKRIWSQSYQMGGPGFAYNDPIVVGDRLIVAPSDGSQVTAFDRATGQPRWRWKPPQNKGDIAYIAGATSRVLLMAGRHVVAIDMKSGETLWGPMPLRGAAYGRGFVGQTCVYVPTRGANATIERFAIESGARGATLRFDVMRLGNLLWLDDRLFVAAENEVMCFSTLEREVARPSSALDRALVAALHESGEAAMKRFSAAMRASPRGSRMEVRWLALHHGLRLARAEKNPSLLKIVAAWATEPETRAQVALVTAELSTAEARERALKHLETAAVEVVYKGRVVRSDKVARILRGED